MEMITTGKKKGFRFALIGGGLMEKGGHEREEVLEMLIFGVACRAHRDPGR